MQFQKRKYYHMLFRQADQLSGRADMIMLRTKKADHMARLKIVQK